MRSSPRNAPAESRYAVAAAAAVALAAFALYRATLLPGVDFGDTGSFQTTVGSPILTPRVGYPLFFAIGGAFLHASGADPAYALNLITAIQGAIACGLLVLAVTELAGSLAAGTTGALLFMVSYTFWSQSITGEVYALHIVLVLGSLILLLRWERRPTLGRLGAFFACYALAFGNHLSTILLAPAFTVFLLASAPGGWRDMVKPRVVALALGCAAAGASQYVWNLRSMWLAPDPPASIAAALGAFWFDVTKSDWRDTMVLEVPPSLLRDRLAMYWFDLQQQCGIVGPIAAGAGMLLLAATQPRRAWLMTLLFAVGFGFAFSYNVGDTHAFYLPSHLFVVLLASVGIAACRRFGRHGTVAAAAMLAAYAGFRGYRDFPALDRSRDTRPTQVLQAMTSRLDEQNGLLLVDLNWQVANGLSYFAKSVRPDLLVVRARDVLLYAPALVHDNAVAGRRVVATERAGRLLSDAYGPLFESTLDSPPPTFEQISRSLPPGTRYVACVLKPARDMALDTGDLQRAVAALSSGRTIAVPPGDYAVIAGVAGGDPVIAIGSDRPFTRTVDIGGVDVRIRMESWLTSDTIRRMGFGHVIAGRHHTLIVERGISFATFDDSGAPLQTAYFANVFEMPRRYLIRTAW